MRKLSPLILAAAITFGGATTASAIDFKIKGYWSLSYEVATNSAFVNSRAGGSTGDDFSAGERLRLQLEAKASKYLSGTVGLEIGDIYYGLAEKRGRSVGGALGADGSPIKLKRAFLDWEVPRTDIKVRMGIQGMKLPLFASDGNFVLDDDAAGIVVSSRVNENVSVTGMWARLLNDNPLETSPQYHNSLNYDVSNPDHDALDFFSLLVPLRFNGLQMTPWLGLATMGDGVGRNPNKDYSEDFIRTSRKKLQEGMGVYTGTGKAPMLLEYGGGETYTWWGGLSANLSRFDPFILKFDFMYGNKRGNGMYRDKTYTKDNGKVKKLGKHAPLDADRYNRSGWFASVLAEYKMDWGTPGIFAWYSSGDDDDLGNGSERMPAMSGNWDYTHTGFKGTTASGAYDGLFAYQPIGLWGLALQLREVPLMEDLKTHLKVLYMRGTNSANMPKKIAESQFMLGESVSGISPAGAIGSYLTTNDWAMEVDWNTEYKIYENLKLIVEASYLYVDFDKDTWSYTAPDGVKYGRDWVQRPDNPNVFKVGMNFHYSF